MHRSTGATRTVIGAIGETHMVSLEDFKSMPGVMEVVRISEPYKLASRTFKHEDTVIDVGGVRIGGRKIVVMAGPCAVESGDQVRVIAERIAEAGAQFLRGGAFKPRTSPYSFSGMGEPGLVILRTVADEFGLKVITEVMDRADIGVVAKYADVIQVGARNMQNFTLLRALGTIDSPSCSSAVPRPRTRMADVCRVHPFRRQSAGHALRARHPHVRDLQRATP